MLLQGLSQFAQQPRILDGDDGLGGEILNQFDLLVGEWPDLLSIDDDCADQHVVFEHWHDDGDRAPPSVTAGLEANLGGIVGSVAHLLCPHDAIS